MKLKLIGSAAILAALLATSAASAATLVETGSYGFAPTDFDVADGNAGTISIADFNPALGKLSSIVVSFTANDQATASATNNNPRGSKNVSAQLSSDLTLSGPEGAGSYTYGTLSPNQTVTASLPHGTTTDFGGTLQSSLSDSYTLSPNSPSAALFNSFVGTGSYDFTLEAFANSVVKGSGNFSSSISTQAQGLVSVTYTYAPVPEPATWAMMLVGFGGMGAAMRSRRRSVTAAA